MRSATLVSAVLALVGLAAAQTDAPVVTDNPIGATYIAKLPDRKDTTARGAVTATSHPDGKGVDFAVSFDGLPESGGPFLYHIHDQPVPSDGNCTGTLAHLDPYNRGETPPCDASAPQTCQVGDLSGKYGTFNTTSFEAHYTDLYASLVPGAATFFGNRSIVVHFANKTRITCANFTEVSKGTETGKPYNSWGAPSSTPCSTSTPAPVSTSCSTLITATPASSESSAPALVTPSLTVSSYSNVTVTTSSKPLAQTVNAAVNMIAPLPFAVAVAAAAFL